MLRLEKTCLWQAEPSLWLAKAGAVKNIMKKSEPETQKQEKGRLGFKSKRIILKLPIILVIIALTGVLVVAPFFFTLYNFGFFEKQYKENGVFEKIGEDNALLATYNMFSFFKCRDSKFGSCEDSLKIVYSYNNQTFGFSKSEIGHLNDVKRVILGFTWVLIFLLIVIIFYTTFLFVAYKRRKKLRHFLSIMSKSFFRSGLYLLGILILLGIITLFFDSAFHVFHSIFFPQGNFSFPASSLIKTLFPDVFFLNFVKKMASIMIIECIIFIVLGLVGSIYFRKIKTKSVESFE